MDWEHGKQVKSEKNKKISSKTTRTSSGKGTAPAKLKPDGRRRKLVAAIDAPDRRDIWEAFAFGQRIGFAPTVTIDFHPMLMDEYPAGEIGVWFKDELRNRITTWLRRRGVGWYAIWIRENYVGDRREHLHLMIYCPARLRKDLEEAMRRWYPGQPEMLKMGVLTYRKNHRTGYMSCPGLEYRMKQMTSKAWGPPRPTRPRREVENRRDKSPVAPVLGRRYGTSETLSYRARKAWEAERSAWWDAERAEQQLQADPNTA